MRGEATSKIACCGFESRHGVYTMPVTYRRIKRRTLKGDIIDVKMHRFLNLRMAISNARLWLAKKIVPHGWTVVDEGDVSYFCYLKDLVRKQRVEGND